MCVNMYVCELVCMFVSIGSRTPFSIFIGFSFFKEDSFVHRYPGGLSGLGCLSGGSWFFHVAGELSQSHIWSLAL